MAITKQPAVSAAALKDLQTRINTDEKARKEFFRSPAAVLKREGVVLPRERQAALSRFLKEAVATNADAEVTGIRSRSAANRIEVVVTVGVRF